EGDLRSLILWLLKRGWLFPGVTPRTRHLYQGPGDLKEKINRLFAEEYLEDAVEEPVVYRDEQGMLARDLHRFLSFVMHKDVPLPGELAIFRHLQRKQFKPFLEPEKLVDEEGWRLGLGRGYHLYPDRSSLIYAYAYYQGYITEEETGWIRLPEKGAG